MTDVRDRRSEERGADGDENTRDQKGEYGVIYVSRVWLTQCDS